LTHSQLAVIDVARREVENALSRLYEVQKMGSDSRPEVVATPVPVIGTAMMRVDVDRLPPRHSPSPSPSLSAMSDASLMSFSDSSVTSLSTGMGPPPTSGPAFDPNCCGGLFDCSSLPGIAMSTARTPVSETPLRRGSKLRSGGGPIIEPSNMTASVPVEVEETHCCYGVVDCGPEPGCS
jgi:hypothetical protein